MAGKQTKEEFKSQPRLPNFISPKSYDVFLKLDLSACQFAGSAAIAVEVVSETRFIVLNSAALVIDEDSVVLQSEQEIRPSNIVLVEEDEILVLEFDSVLPIGEAVLKIEFTGTLNDQMKGFYISKCEYKGETQNMAVTQFQSVDARRCFPCWDEPAFKAKFKISLEVPDDLVALSNMPVSEEKVNNEGLKTLHFEESPLMSTYLVAILIGYLDYIESQTQDGTKVRVYTQVGKSEQGKFALDFGIKCLDFYTDYFGLGYPLPKLDMVAVPDFAMGAMENYGLVTYREVAILFDPLLSAASDKQRVAVTVAHELAHQWFGNLVTLEWWSHLWLNEGFATWVFICELFSGGCSIPEWNTWTQFLDETSNGMRLDALSESHPIEVEIKHANEVDSIFDPICYEKGANIIRMLHSFLGPDRFQKALAAYIKKCSYANAKTEDLWAVLEEETGEPVKDLMSSWTKQQGYPVIYTSLTSTELQISQEQFLSDGSSGTGTWMVPVILTCSSNETKKKFILKSKSDMFDLKDLIENENNKTFWIKLNADQAGFYRVKYDDQLSAGLRCAIKANKLSLTDKYGIINDALALNLACKETVSSLLTLLKAYAGESDFTILSQVIDGSLSVARVVKDVRPELFDNTKSFLTNLLQPSAQRLGWDSKEGESHLDSMLRDSLIRALINLDHKATIDEGIRRFDIFLKDPNSSILSPDTREAAYMAVMRRVTASDKSGYESLLEIFRETTESQEKLRVLGILPRSPDKSVVLEALNFLLTDEVRKQDAAWGTGVSTECRETVWQWLKDNWEYISKTWGSSCLISGFIHSIVPRFNSYEKAEEIEEFFASRTLPTFERALKQCLERVRISAKWTQSFKNDQSLADVISNLTQNA